MENLIDQFKSEQASHSIMQKSIIGTETFKNFKLEHDPAIFSKLRINFVPSFPILHMVVCNGHIIIAMTNMVVMKIDLLKPNNIKEVDLKKYMIGRVANIYLDPTGKHAIISIVNTEGSTYSDILYLHWDSSVPKVCSKLKGMAISAVGWDIKGISETSTGPMLVATQTGFIYEIELTTEEGLFNNSCEKYFKLLHEVKDDANVAISKLDIMECSSNELLYLIFCTIHNKVYRFMGCAGTMDDRPFFGSMFKNCTSTSSKFLELTLVSSWSSILQFERQSDCMAPKSYVWLAEQEIQLGELNWSSPLEDMVTSKHTHTHPKAFEGGLIPRGFIATQFHIVIAYASKVQAICILNNRIIFEESLPEECANIVGITEDILNKTIWVFAEKGVFKYKIANEDRNVWSIYLEQGKYSLAKQYCTSEGSRLSYILFKEAEDLFNKKQFEEAAMVYSRIPAFIEEICLKLLEKGADEALKVYLRQKLVNISSKDKTQIFLIVMWLLEIYLKELGLIRDTEGKSCSKYVAADQKFKEFLLDRMVKECINQNSLAVYNLLSSHDDQDNYIAIAVIMKDFNRVVMHLYAHQRYKEALDVMATQGSVELCYQHVPALLQQIPKETVKQLIAMGPMIDPTVLLPNLTHVHATHGFTSEVLEYVEYCVNQLEIKDQSMHNFLITLYCEQSPDKLLSYLKLQGDNSECVCYDVKFALRECSTAGHDESSIHILITMNLFLEAVELALKSNVALAKAVAKRAKNNEALCKDLWLMIAAQVIQEDQNIQKAMEILKECPLIKIEDILPFFPDFVTINEFKSAICSSLQSYNEQIENLKEEMEESTKVANDIRNNIKQFKQKSETVHSFDKCNECGYPLMNRSFYLFNCEHKFHDDCLSEAVIFYLPEGKRKQLANLQRKLLSLSTGTKKSHSNVWAEREQLRLKIGNIVAAECLYCGELAIDNVDTPFIAKHEWDNQISDWL